MWWIIGSLIGSVLYKDKKPLCETQPKLTLWQNVIVAIIILIVVLLVLGWVWLVNYTSN
jgi:biotin transporter BioY